MASFVSCQAATATATAATGQASAGADQRIVVSNRAAGPSAVDLVCTFSQFAPVASHTVPFVSYTPHTPTASPTAP